MAMAKSGLHKLIINIKNWRPITILNTDYKILTKILSNRLKKVLPKIIHSDQTGFVLGRQIGENIRIVHDIMTYCDENDISGIMAFLDFEKAFDSIDWNFLNHTLRTFGFGQYFIDWINIFYASTNSSVMNNGHIAKSFNLQRGISKGCPISAYLFILCVELLAQRIRECAEMEGLIINSKIYKILQFADDTVLILKNQTSLSTALSLIDRFYKVSGLKLNVQKTILIELGNSGLIIPPHLSGLGLKFSTEEVRYLGIYFHKNSDIMEYKNYRHRIEKIKNILKLWRQRDLSMKGRVTVLKALAISQLTYPLTYLSVPKWVVTEANTLFYKFLWDDGVERVARITLQRDIALGGIKMVDLETTAKVLKLKWITRLLDQPDDKWSNIPLMYFDKINMLDFCQSAFHRNYVPVNLPPFYKECLGYLLEIKSNDILTTNDVKNQILWYNYNLLKGGQPYWIKTMYQAGIKRIGDLLNKRNEFLLHNDLEKRFGITINFLDFYSIRNAIPGAWKIMLKENIEGEDYPPDNLSLYINGHIKSLKKCENVEIYRHLIKLKEKAMPGIWQYWMNQLNIQFDQLSEYFKLPYRVVRECKLQSLQYKIVNNFYATRLRLKQWTLKPVDSCLKCNNTDDLIHHFCECPEMMIFWNSFQNWWSQYCQDCNINHFVDVLLGNLNSSCHFKQLNFIILYAKQYIARTKYNEENCDLLTFLPELQNILKVERLSMKIRGKTKQFDELWNFMYN
jgi:hypothetical protein